MHGFRLTKEKAPESDVKSGQQVPKEINKATHKLLLTKEKASETEVTAEQWAPKVNSPKVTGKKRSYEDSVQWASKSQEGSEPMHELPLTKGKAPEADVKSVQPDFNMQDRLDNMIELLTNMDKPNETEVTAVQWAPQEIRLLASSSNNGSIKIWELTRG